MSLTAARIRRAVGLSRRPHFSGNMWWTTAEHWAQLPVELPKTRHAPEYFSTYKGA